MLQPGQIIEDKYRIVRLIGQGGMGEVYEGENIAIARRVAIKVLLNAAATSPDIVQRFEREAQAAGRIGNDHILEVLDLGTLPAGDRFMVMEFLDGEPLNARIQRLGRLTPQQSIPLMLQALTGLSAAHTAGIIHRDLKPENIFVLKQKAGVLDFVKIIDFGISKFNVLASEGMKMTRTGSVMGTPYYMSPEQANGSREADARSDLYAMGVILYEAVTGAVPFDGKTFNELLFKIVLSDPPPPRQLVPDLDPAFESLILKAMAREAAHRFQSCEEFSEALRGYQSGAAPEVVQRHTPQTRVEPRLNTAAGVPPTGTGASWSKTGDVPKRSSAPLIAAMLGVVVLAGGAFAAFKLHSGPAPAPSAAKLDAPAVETAAAAAPQAPVVDLVPAPPPVPSASEAPAAAPSPEPAPPVETAHEAAAKPRAQALVAPHGRPASGKKEPTVAAPTPPPAAAAPPPAAAPAPKPAPKPASSPDFGY